MKKFFSPKEAMRASELSYRQLQYWDNTKFISPSLLRRGKYRVYTSTDVLLLRIAEQLRQQGRSIQYLRRVIVKIRRALTRDLAPLKTLSLMIEADNVLIIEGRVWGDTDAKGRVWVVLSTLIGEINKACPDTTEIEDSMQRAVEHAAP